MIMYVKCLAQGSFVSQQFNKWQFRSFKIRWLSLLLGTKPQILRPQLNCNCQGAHNPVVPLFQHAAHSTSSNNYMDLYLFYQVVSTPEGSLKLLKENATKNLKHGRENHLINANNITLLLYDALLITKHFHVLDFINL